MTDHPPELTELERRLRVALYEDGTARWRRPSRSGALAVGLSAAVALVVAVLALAIGHGGSGPSQPASAVPGTARLLARLAVLRRPQTASDRTLPARLTRIFAQAFGQPIVASLTRLAQTVQTPAGSARIYLVVQPPAPGRGPLGPAFGKRLGDQVSTITVGPKGGAGGGGGQPAGALTDPRNIGTDGYVNEGIVPDGVTYVKWVYDGDYDGHVKHPRTVTIYPTVRGNVAAARVVHNQGLLASATWYGRGGQVVASYDATASYARIDRLDARLRAQACRGLPTAAHPPTPLVPPAGRPLTLRIVCAVLGKPTSVSTPFLPASVPGSRRQTWLYGHHPGLLARIPGTEIVIAYPAAARHRRR